MKHDELLADLASNIEKSGINGSRMIFLDIPMGAAGSCRPDIFSLEKSFSRPLPTSYEIKEYYSDFSGYLDSLWSFMLDQRIRMIKKCANEGFTIDQSISIVNGVINATKESAKAGVRASISSSSRKHNGN